MGCAGRIKAALFKWLNSASHSALRSGHSRLVISLPKNYQKQSVFRTLTPPWRLVRPCGCLAGLSHPNPLLTRTASHAPAADAFSYRSLTLLSPRHRYWALNPKAPAAPHPTPTPPPPPPLPLPFRGCLLAGACNSQSSNTYYQIILFFPTVLCSLPVSPANGLNHDNKWVEAYEAPVGSSVHADVFDLQMFFFFLPRSPFHFLPPSQIFSASLTAPSFIVSLPRVNTVASANNFPVFQTPALPFTADRWPQPLTPHTLCSLHLEGRTLVSPGNRG